MKMQTAVILLNIAGYSWASRAGLLNEYCFLSTLHWIYLLSFSAAQWAFDIFDFVRLRISAIARERQVL